MNGGPSQIDLFDYKPKMHEMFDKDLPESIRKGQRLTTMTSGQARFSRRAFEVQVRAARPVGDVVSASCCRRWRNLPTILRSSRPCGTEAINHDPAVTYICTGNQLPGRPSLGSWLSYGLGTMNQNLPAFVVMTASWSSKVNAQALYNRLWSAGNLPSKHQGVALRSIGDPVPVLVETLTALTQALDAGRSIRSTGSIIVNTSRLPIPRPRPGSPSTRWPSGCKRRFLNSPTFRASRRIFWICTGRTFTGLGHMPDVACSPGGLPSAMSRFVQIFHRGWDQHGKHGWRPAASVPRRGSRDSRLDGRT